MYTDKCAGCRHVDPLLPHIEEVLKGKYGSKNIAFGKIHLLNEAAFLQDINQTPTFVLYDKKYKEYIRIDLEDSDEAEVDQNSELNEDEILINTLVLRISNAIK